MSKWTGIDTRHEESMRVSRSHWSFKRVFPLDWNQNASSSRVVNAVFVTTAPTVKPLGNTGGGELSSSIFVIAVFF